MNLLELLSETSSPAEVIIDDTWYSPGVVGFVATFGLGAAALLLVGDLVRRIRRVRYRAEISEKLDQEMGGATDPASSIKPVKLERPEPPTKPER